MRKILFSSTMSIALLCSSCLGSFSAFNNLKDWNQDITENKFVNNLVFWALNIVPVYGLFFFGDTIIFNVIEFWSGSNPIAMNENDREIEIKEMDGNTFEMIATKNRMQIKVIDGYRKGDKLDLVYSPTNESWSAIKANGTIIKLSSMEEGFYVVHLPNGKEVKLDPMASKETNLALLNAKVSNLDCQLAYN